MNRSALLFLLGTLLMPNALHAGPSAEELLRHSGLNAGVAVVTPAGDGSLALELAAKPGWTVIVAEPDAARLEEFRKAASETGLLGTSLYPVEAAADALPITNAMVDLLIDQSATTPGEALRTELVRVLTPIRGTAYFTGAPDAGALRTWAAPAAGQAWTLIEESLPAGVPLAVRRLELPGSDWWTHRMHDAGNNAASEDEALQKPIALQFLATPLYTSFQGVALTGGGRHFEITDSATKNPSRIKLALRLRARSVYNGSILWEKALPEGYEPDFPTAALAGDALVLARPDKPEVIVFDAETGNEKGSIALSDNPELRIQWIGVDGDTLFALLGPPYPKKQPFDFIGNRATKEAMEKRGLLGSTIAAVDLPTAKPLWSHKEESQIDYRHVAARDGRLYVYSHGNRLACFDRAGALLWENNDPAWLSELKTPATNEGANGNTQSSPLIAVGPSHLKLTSHNSKAFFFDNSTGAMTAPTGGAIFKGFFIDDVYRTNNGDFDPATGEKRAGSKMEVLGRPGGVGGCGLISWVPGLEAGLSHTVYGFKSPCGIGAWSAGGVLLMNPSHCDCSTSTVRGSSGFFGAGDLFERIENRPEHPLVQHGPVQPFAGGSDADWTHYLSSFKHNGSSTAAVPTTQPAAQTIALERPLPIREGYDTLDNQWYDRPNPAVTAGNLSLWANTTGRITAADSATGEPVWTRQLTTPILGTLIVDGDLVFAPGGDGYVHALNIADGSPVWSWRAAPADRRMMIFGKLLSSWPVLSLMVEDGKVYGTAGFSHTLGSVVFSLDARTGKPLWATVTPPDFRSPSIVPPDAFAPGGEITMVDGKLWVKSDFIVGIFDGETGARVPAPEIVDQIWKEALGFYISRLTVEGRDLVQISDDLILQGGQSLFDDTSDRRSKKQDYQPFAPAPDGSGNFDVILPLPFAVPGARSAPVSDGEFLAVVGGQPDTFVNQGLSFWDLEEWKASVQRIDDEEKAAAAKRPKRGGPNAKATAQRQAKMDKWSQLPVAAKNAYLDVADARWSKPDLQPNAVALTSNAVLAAHGIARADDRSGRHPGFESWHLTAFDRNNGTELWTIELPSEPIYNGISVGANGAITVVHRDGSATVTHL